MNRNDDWSNAIAAAVVVAVIAGAVYVLSGLVTLVVKALVTTRSPFLWAALVGWGLAVAAAIALQQEFIIWAAIAATSVLLAVAKIEEVRYEQAGRQEWDSDDPLASLTSWWED